MEIGQIGNMAGHPITISQPINVKIKKTWKERLFSLPWKPWVKFRYELQEVIEDGQVFKVGHTLIMNRKTAKDLADRCKL